MSGLITPPPAPPSTPQPKGPMVRILFCEQCRSVEEIPPYEGPPEHDQLLQYKVSPHHFPSGTWHPLELGRVEQEVWDKPSNRDGILQKFAVEKGHIPGEGSGLGKTFYDLKDNFKADAMRCWKEHNRTTDCGDYRSKAKELLADTKADRKAEGMSTAARDRPKHWLCDYCVVQSIVMQAQRKARGDYN